MIRFLRNIMNILFVFRESEDYDLLMQPVRRDRRWYVTTKILGKVTDPISAAN
jgi:hypothetical protein